MYGVAPSLYSTTFNDYIDIDEADYTTGLTLSEKLYTVRGSQEIIVSAGIAQRANLAFEKPVVVETEGVDLTRVGCSTAFPWH